MADIARAVGERGYDIVFCSYEGGLLTLSRRREEIAPAVWPYPPYEVVRRTFDKLDLFGAAHGGRSAHPVHRPGGRGLARQLVGAGRREGPQPRAAPLRHGRVRQPAYRRAALVEQTLAEGGEPLLQTPLSGKMGARRDRGGPRREMLAELHQEAERTWPPGAGDTVLGRVIATDAELSGAARAAGPRARLDRARPDRAVPRRATARPSITDFNGRFYGSMALAVRAGVNVPAIWARDALGLDPWNGPGHRRGADRDPLPVAQPRPRRRLGGRSRRAARRRRGGAGRGALDVGARRTRCRCSATSSPRPGADCAGAADVVLTADGECSAAAPQRGSPRIGGQAASGTA